MKIYLIRHGESQSNYDKKNGNHYFCGQMDVPLTEKGEQSAVDLQTYFADKEIDHVYLSDLTRTKQTAQGIFPNDKVPKTETPLLRERSLGKFEGEMVDELEQSTEFAQYFNDEAYKYFRHSFSQKAPEGESYADVLYRVEQFFKNEVQAQDDNIAIVAHQVVIRCILVYFGYESKENAVDTKVENCVPYVLDIK
ncbi:histidine phosphatase family protein [Staphylococcus gallinarum]|uniref:histidine phosphatase family protein n=1 Tax=Staphylococcus gallinarum TaxID=1293 RepID=UPI000D1E6E8C|nr:histidine phosphatase family protein [Staphylococcus gallinarum]MCD8829143.1 histidine phosphatase family protein [Staphylococcus gallinarum]MCD8917407.1 histidine phosphatase family protein [Staphylococcus gallinarum]MDN6414214.1 histidine phosphatase family protein [Staphylococcus gallinarum]MEB6055890.1 histidine phosphatase family protein [Staphylococcus gallinarum]PTK94552.1 histidine phosphatase family protein [Staphylococcus gallinarum]